MKILVVDDSKAMRMIIILTLKQTGLPNLSTIEAGNGIEALQMVATHRPDAIVCDWNMPEMSGIELIRRLRDSGSETPFGFVTAECSPEIRREAEEAGAAFFLVKPFTPLTFEAVLMPALTKS